MTIVAIAPFFENVLQRVCDILGDTSTGLTESEIGRYLGRLGVRRRLRASPKPIAARACAGVSCGHHPVTEE